MKYIQRSAPIFSPHPEGMSRHVVDEKGVFTANFLIGSRRGKTNLLSILHPFWLQAGTFLDLLDGLGAQVGPASILGRFWGALGVALGGLGAPLASLWALHGVPGGLQTRKKNELCDHDVAKPRRQPKTGCPDPA